VRLSPRLSRGWCGGAEEARGGGGGGAKLGTALLKMEKEEGAVVY
jgi:hypothetical protein